jgi:hypothetical protein
MRMLSLKIAFLKQIKFNGRERYKFSLCRRKVRLISETIHVKKFGVSYVKEGAVYLNPGLKFKCSLNLIHYQIQD